MYSTENFNQSTFKPAHFEATGVLPLHGKDIPYRTVAEDTAFYDPTGKAIATIFSYSYFRTDVEDTASRPVLFCYNGGPGGCSMYVHAGFLGAKRICYGEPNRPDALPPYQVIDNPDCLLDIADLVMIDPVGTGYGLLIDDACANQFFGIEEDAEALLYFIEKWLHKHNRWLSPKYLVGESYGCTRNAVAAGMASGRSAHRSFNIAFDGIVNIGNTITVGKYFNREVPVEPAVLAFPTYAAINWYHNHPSQQTLEEFTQEAKHFADTEYMLALYRDESMTQSEKDAVIDRIHYYTGASIEYIRSHDMRFDDPSYRSDVIKDKGEAVARFDARITRPVYTPEQVELTAGMRDDASSDRYGAYYRAAVNGVIYPSMNITLDRTYVTSYGMWNPESKKSKWNNEAPLGTTGEQLRSAMYKTPGMRVFFANGWFDMATYTGIVYYTLDHAGLPKDRIAFKRYASGHMIYIGEDNCKELCDDIRSFITGGMPENG